MSETVRLRNEDSDVTPYRSSSEPLLYYDGHIHLDIPIKVDDITVQASDTVYFQNQSVSIGSCQAHIKPH